MLALLLPGLWLKGVALVSVLAFLGVVHLHGVKTGRAKVEAEVARRVAAANARIRDKEEEMSRRLAAKDAKIADLQKSLADDVRAIAMPIPVTSPGCKPVKCQVPARTKGTLNQIMDAVRW